MVGKRREKTVVYSNEANEENMATNTDKRPLMNLQAKRKRGRLYHFSRGKTSVYVHRIGKRGDCDIIRE